MGYGAVLQGRDPARALAFSLPWEQIALPQHSLHLDFRLPWEQNALPRIPCTVLSAFRTLPQHSQCLSVKVMGALPISNGRDLFEMDKTKQLFPQSALVQPDSRLERPLLCRYMILELGVPAKYSMRW